MAQEPQKPDSHYAALAGTIGASSVAIFFIAAMFGGGQLWPATLAVVALATMGVGIAFIMNKNR